MLGLVGEGGGGVGGGGVEGDSPPSLNFQWSNNFSLAVPLRPPTPYSLPHFPPPPLPLRLKSGSVTVIESLMIPDNSSMCCDVLNFLLVVIGQSTRERVIIYSGFLVCIVYLKIQDFGIRVLLYQVSFYILKNVITFLLPV